MKKIILSILTLTLFVACQEQDGPSSGERDVFKRASKGTHHELMVVLEDEAWQGRFGEYLRETLAEPVKDLTEPEARFSFFQVNNSAFDQLLFETYKSIIIFEERDTTPYYQVVYDEWAAPQIIVYYGGRSINEMGALFARTKNDVLKKIEDHDRKVLIRRLRKMAYNNLPPELAEVHVEDIVLPNGFYLSQSRENLKVFKSQNVRTDQYIFFHVRPIGENPMGEIIEVRDSILKNYFEGPSEDSYLGTEMRMPPTLTQTTIDNNIAFKLSGRWRTYGDFMGGPFVSYTVFLDDQDLVVTVDGFINGPDGDHRKLMMEMEAIMESMKFKQGES